MKTSRSAILITTLTVFFLVDNPVLAQHAGHGGAQQPQTQQPAKAQPPAKGEPEEAPTVEIPLDKQQLIGLKTAVVAFKPLHRTIRTVGRIEYNEQKFATVNAKFEGWIEKLHVDYTGKYVKKGEPLAEIYSPELLATQQEFLNLLKWSRPGTDAKEQSVGRLLEKDTAMTIESARQRLRLWDISDEQIKSIEETGKTVRTLTIYSPVDGYVVQKMALQGMRFMAGEKLFDIADLSTVWVISDIYEYEISFVKPGQKARISLSYFPGKEFISSVEYVYPNLAVDTRTAKVRFVIPNPGGLLKPQMFTNVEITVDLGKRLAIPEDAIIDTGTRQIVYVDKGEGNFEPREVTVGLRADGMVEVIKGLKPKEKVATAANFLIDSEARLKGVVSTGSGGHQH
jgi:Cu(I)/Ag(I) efflux system membrane fusion protein